MTCCIFPEVQNIIKKHINSFFVDTEVLVEYTNEKPTNVEIIFNKQHTYDIFTKEFHSASISTTYYDKPSLQLAVLIAPITEVEHSVYMASFNYSTIYSTPDIYGINTRIYFRTTSEQAYIEVSIYNKKLLTRLPITQYTSLPIFNYHNTNSKIEENTNNKIEEKTNECPPICKGKYKNVLLHIVKGHRKAQCVGCKKYCDIDTMVSDCGGKKSVYTCNDYWT